jgi:WD40 repeat protein
LSPGGKTVVTCDHERHLLLWDWAKDTRQAITLPASKSGLEITFHVAISPDGRWLVVGAGTRDPLRVFESATGKMVYELDVAPSSSAISWDSQRLVAVDAQQSGTALVVFDLRTGKELARTHLSDHREFMTSASIAPDGRTVVCADSNKTLVVDCLGKQVLHRIPGHADRDRFAPDGKLFGGISGAHYHREGGRYLRFWDASTAVEHKPAPGNVQWPWVFSPDGKVLAAAAKAEPVVNLWEVETGKLIRQRLLKGADTEVEGLQFSANGQTITALGRRGSYWSWNATDGKELPARQLNGQAERGEGFLRMYLTNDAKKVCTLEFRLDPQFKPTMSFAHLGCLNG